MTDVSRGRGVFGRFLAALGLVWVFWGFLGPAIGLQFGNSALNLPILPGLVIFFIGRSLLRGARRGRSKPGGDTATEAPIPSRPEPRVRPAPVPERTIREPLPIPESVTVPEVTVEAVESPEPGIPLPEEMPPRKTSAEMVAEARERYGRRL